MKTQVDSVIQLYLLANNASIRLTTECNRPDQCLRRMVAHATMLDRLTAEINARENALFVLDVAVRPKPGPGHRTPAKATASA